MQDKMCIRDSLITVWQCRGIIPVYAPCKIPSQTPPGKEFPPIGKAFGAWVLLGLIGSCILMGFNLIIAILAIFFAGFIAKGMGWNV